MCQASANRSSIVSPHGFRRELLLPNISHRSALSSLVQHSAASRAKKTRKHRVSLYLRAAECGACVRKLLIRAPPFGQLIAFFEPFALASITPIGTVNYTFIQTPRATPHALRSFGLLSNCLQSACERSKLRPAHRTFVLLSQLELNIAPLKRAPLACLCHRCCLIVGTLIRES
jgi:hypothetical protein